MSSITATMLCNRQHQNQSSCCITKVASKANKIVHTDNNANACCCLKIEHHTDTQETFTEQDNTCREVQQVHCGNDSVLVKQTDLYLMKTNQKSFPSENQKIEEGNLGGQFGYNQKPCSSTIMNAKLDESYDNEQLGTENQRKEDGSEKERNYQVVLVSDKDLIAKEFRGVLTEKADGCQSVEKSENITEKFTAQNFETFSKTREVDTSGSSCNKKSDEDSSVDIISLEEFNDSSSDDISQRYLCYICGKSYKQLSHLSRHTKDAHSKEQFHQCTICDTTFTRSWSLIRHLKLHEQRNGSGSTKGPFKCPKCTKSFQQPYNVSRHLLTHSGAKPFQCPECSKSFTQHTGLARHLILHKGSKDFKCEECGKAFARLFVLNRHRLTHTNDKPYKCFVCSKSFIRAGQLQGHIKSHQENDTNCNKSSMKLRKEKDME